MRKYVSIYNKGKAKIVEDFELFKYIGNMRKI